MRDNQPGIVRKGERIMIVRPKEWWTQVEVKESTSLENLQAENETLKGELTEGK